MKLNWKALETHLVALAAVIATFVAGAHPGIHISAHASTIVAVLPQIIASVFAIGALAVEIYHAATKHQFALVGQDIHKLIPLVESSVGQILHTGPAPAPVVVNVHASPAAPIPPLAVDVTVAPSTTPGATA